MPVLKKPLRDKRIKIVGRTTGYRGHFRLDIIKLRHRKYDGTWTPTIQREVFERGHAAAIVLYDPQRDALVLIEQFRTAAHLAGFRGWQTEIVAGILDKRGESARSLVIREAREEAGIEIIGAPLRALRFLTTPGGSTESLEVFVGRVDSRRAGGVHGLAEEHEDIRVKIKSFAQVQRMMARGQITNGPSLLALYWFAANRDRLRKRWRRP